MKIYISGPMRGYKDFNKDSFSDAAFELRSVGHEVINPHEIDTNLGIQLVSPTGDVEDVPGWNENSMEEAIKRDVAAVLECDGIYMLVGWHHSLGASAEYRIAKWAGKNVMFEKAY